MTDSSPVGSVPAGFAGQFYAALSAAYERYNAELFQNALPGCLVTLQRKRGVYGYYSPARFAPAGSLGDKDEALKGRTVDEIALNPVYFAERSSELILSTLVHEMVHMWQHHLGSSKPKTGYHNKEWADKMQSLGLPSSNTGQAGGKRTGHRMSHYIDESGLFASVTKVFLNEYSGLCFYFDRAQDKKRSSRSNTAVTRPRMVTYMCKGCSRKVRAQEKSALWCGACGKAYTRASSKPSKKT